MTISFATPKDLTRAYFDLWTTGRFEEASALLSDMITIETPINTYPGKPDFVAVLTAFGSLVSATHHLADLGDGEDVVQIYDMEVAGLGVIRMAEHFVVRDSQITQIRQIHDTAALRAAGFDRQAS